MTETIDWLIKLFGFIFADNAVINVANPFAHFAKSPIISINILLLLKLILFKCFIQTKKS